MTQFDPFFIAIGSLSVLIFIITSMLGMGFSLTIPQILTPLKNRRLVIMSLVANFGTCTCPCIIDREDHPII